MASTSARVQAQKVTWFVLHELSSSFRKRQREGIGQTPPLSGGAQRAICAWLSGTYTLQLIDFVPSPMEMLEAQCAGQRFVTLLEGPEHLHQQIGRHQGSLAFLLHDLEHADKFFFDTDRFHGQVKFFRCLKATLHHLQFLMSDDLFVKDLHYVMADMNSHPIHLFKYFKAIVLMAFLRQNNLHPKDLLSDVEQTRLDDFWRTVLHEWQMTERQIVSGVRMNRPNIELAEDAEHLDHFFNTRTTHGRQS